MARPCPRGKDDEWGRIHPIVVVAGARGHLIDRGCLKTSLADDSQIVSLRLTSALSAISCKIRLDQGRSVFPSEICPIRFLQEGAESAEV
jgi:hypothetical protein